VFACLFGPSAHLKELAGQFSPLVETVADDTVVFSIAGLGRLFGDTNQIASEISRRGAEMNITANLAIAANPAAAILAARHLPGVTTIARGREPEILGALPVAALPADLDLLVTLERWGIGTLAELAALPEIGIVERFGEAGARLRRLALGQETRILDAAPPPKTYTARHELDHAAGLLEPLLFIVSSQLHDLTQQLHQNGQAAGRVTVTLELDGGGEFTRVIELPVAMRDPKALLKQVQLSLEAHPPEAETIAIRLTLDPVDPRIVQGGLFMPAAPEPEKLQTLLARLRALAGEDHVGSPEILNSHRPDAHRLRDCAFEPSAAESCGPADERPLCLALRYFRPPLAARVTVHAGLPKRILSDRVSGIVVQAAGPWRTSGEWWTDTAWDRDEWDVVLEDSAIYRLYVAADQWFLDGSYD
jgi:protein ImuB